LYAAARARQSPVFLLGMLMSSAGARPRRSGGARRRLVGCGGFWWRRIVGGGGARELVMTRFLEKTCSRKRQRRISERLARRQNCGKVCVLAGSSIIMTTDRRSALLPRSRRGFSSLDHLSVRKFSGADRSLRVLFFIRRNLLWAGSSFRTAPAARHRAAMEQFMIRGMARKKNRAGVLISSRSRTLRAHRRRRWDRVQGRSIRLAGRDRHASVVRGRRRDRGGLLSRSRNAGVLAEHFPPEPGGEDQLPEGSI